MALSSVVTGILRPCVGDDADHLRANDSTCRPSGQDHAVNNRHQPGAEHIEDEAGHGAESAAVAEQDVAEQRGAAGFGVAHQLRPVSRGGLGEQVVEVGLHGVLGDEQLFLDVGARVAGCPDGQHLLLARR